MKFKKGQICYTTLINSDETVRVKIVRVSKNGMIHFQPINQTSNIPYVAYYRGFGKTPEEAMENHKNWMKEIKN